MKLTMQEIILLNYELNGMVMSKGDQQEVISKGLLKQKASLKVKLYLQRLNKLVADEVALAAKAEQEILDKKKEEGADIEALDAEYKAMLKAEKEIDVKNLWSSDLTVESLSEIETDETYPIFFKLIDK